MASSTSPVTVRLSPDALRLELFLAPNAPVLPAEALTPLIQERAARLQVPYSLSAAELERILQSHRRGTWITLLSGTPSTPPIDGRVELLVPVSVSVSLEHQRLQEGRFAVRAGTPLARLRKGQSGQPGRDLLQREVAPRPPRAARLPEGQNTEVGADGAILLASCDGEVVLRNLLIHVDPMYVHQGDLLPSHAAIDTELPVFITGSIREGAQVTVAGNIHIQGDVLGGHVYSTKGAVSVVGSATGTVERPASLRAQDDIICGAALHARLRAGKDIRLLTEAGYSVLQAEGNVYVQHAIDDSLVHVQLQVGGGIVPLLDPPSPLRDVPADRRHFRVATTIPAQIALHSTTTLAFQPCTVVDLSTGGARCQFPRETPVTEWPPETIVQLKFALPGSEDQVLAVAQISRQIGERVIGVAYLQMTQNDQERVTAYCLQLLMARGHSRLATREDRHQ